MAVVTKYGFVETAKLLANKSGTAFTNIALGTSSTAEGTDCTALIYEITESGLSRATPAATVNTASSATSGDTALYSHTWTATGAYNVSECGVFNSTAGGAMLCYATFASAVPMASADTLQITWSVQCKAG
jgi:hypothetical protein